MLEIKSLGSLTITRDGKSINTLESMRAKVLLTYLSLERGSHHRNYLASMFWPDSPEEKALTSLRVVLTELRKSVGEYLNISRTDVSALPNSQINLDIFEFENSLKTGDISQALALYRGDFLTGIYIPGSIEFENWRRWESERIRYLVIDHLEADVRNKIILGYYHEAAELSRDLLRIDPLNESGHQNYSIALAMAGNRSAAIKNLNSYKKIILEELGIEPSSEIAELRQWISSGDLDSLEQRIKPPSNLPTEQSSFIGRVNAITQVTEFITNPKCRLINIIGPGGIGKSRLALKSIERNCQNFPDGSFYIPLSPVKSGKGLYQAIAQSLDFKFDTQTSLLPPKKQLFDVLEDQKLVLLLDGFEHLAQEGNQLSTLLDNAPNITLIVTSRHKLNVPSEWIVSLEGMDIPTADTDPADPLPEAMELFLRRSEQHNPVLKISAEDFGSIARICTLVEGLPLGIELAAGWVSVLSFSEIAYEISNSFEFLDRQSGTDKKYQDIKAVIKSSWNLLEPSQQLIMAMLSVFRGGFSHQAAKYVAGATLTDLSTLLDKSMLRKNRQGKFEIHSVIQEFSEEVLLENPQKWQDIHKKHFRYYDEYLSIRVPNMHTLEEDCTHSEIKRELHNIQAAAEYAVSRSEKNQDNEIIKNLYSYYIVHGWHEGALAFQQIGELLEEKQIDSQAKFTLQIARIQAQKGFFYSNLGLQEESEEICQSSFPVLENAKEFRELAICIQNLGINAIYRGEYEQAQNLLAKAIKISEQTSCSSFPSFYLWVGYVHFLLGEYQKGMDSLIISLEQFKEDNNARATAFSYSKMGLALDGLGNFQDANGYHNEALKIFKKSKNKAGQGYALSRMSLGSLLKNDYQTALVLGEEALLEFSEIGHRWGRCASLSRIGYAKLGLGELAEAKTHFLEALTIAHEHQLDPLRLHALAGIACLKSVAGAKKYAQSLLQAILHHPKTPEIYLEVIENWFKIDKKHKPQQKNQDMDLELDQIVREILESEL